MEKQKITTIIAPDGSMAGVSVGDITQCLEAWQQVVKKTGKYIPQLQKLGYKIKEGYFVLS